MKNKVFIFISFMNLFALSSCPDAAMHTIKFTNNADYSIAIWTTPDEEWKLPINEVVLLALEPRSSIVSEEAKGDMYYITIFHADTLAKYPWETIVNENKVLANYELSKKKMEKMNWTITYP